MYEYKAVITNVVDGDTYDVDIDLGFHIHIHERIRILDLDTPECRGEEKELGLICKRYAEKEFLNKNVIIKSHEEIQEPKTDSFGRWLCRVWREDNKHGIGDTFSYLGCNKNKPYYSKENVMKLNTYEIGN